MSGGRSRSGQPPQARRRAGSTPMSRGEPVRRGPHLGPLRITPARAFLVVALLGGLAFLGYSIFFRDALQVPLMATGFAISGIVFGVAAAMAVGSVVRAGREGRDATAVLTSIAGGLLAIGSLMFLAAAVIMSLIWGGTSAT